MAKTYGELILEYQNYQYSKENYELTKECYELDLMNQYIESQNFLLENPIELSENFFIEAVDEDVKKKAEDNNDKKSAGVISKIFSGIKKAWTNFTNFFKRLFDKNSKNNQAILKTIEELSNLDIKNLSFSNEQLKELKNILNDCWDQKYVNEGYLISFKHTFTVDHTIDKICDLIPKRSKDLSDKIKAAFTLDSVIINLTNNVKTEKDTYAASYGKLYYMYKDFYDATEVKTNTLEDGSTIEYIDARQIYNATKKLSKDIKDIKDNDSITINVSEKNLDKSVNGLDWMDYKKAKYDLSDSRSRIVYSDINKVYAEMNEILGNTIEMYNHVMKYRSITHSTIAKFINKCINSDSKE